MVKMEAISSAVCEGEDDEIVILCQRAIDCGFDPVDIIRNGLTGGMMEASRLFQSGEYFLPEMLISSMTLQKGLDYLRPFIEGRSELTKGRIVIGTVAGDTHDIGKNLVGAMLKAAGFQVYDLGVDVSAEQFVEAIYKYEPDIVGMSALLSTTMMNMAENIQRFTEEGLRQRVKVMIGGAVVSQTFADRIGADGYSADAVEAVQLARKFMETGD